VTETVPEIQSNLEILTRSSGSNTVPFAGAIGPIASGMAI